MFVCRSAAECLEAALNTLSRALETNCDNPEVWSHYLSLFSRRGSKEEVQEMCEMAVEHAPNYQVWWNVSLRVACDPSAECPQAPADVWLSSAVCLLALMQLSCNCKEKKRQPES